MENQTNLEKWQWAMLVKVTHAPNFGHRIVIETKTRGREPHERSGGYWRGVGIPSGALDSARALVDSILSEHLVTRYGVADQLPMEWGDVPDPF